MTQKTIFIRDVGNVTLQKSSRARNISIRIKPGPEIFLIAPQLLSEKKANSIINERKQWILNKIKHPKFKTRLYLPDSFIKSRYHRVNIQQYDGAQLKSVTINGCFDLLIPQEISPESAQAQTFIINELRALLRKEAKAYLPQRVAFLAHQYNFSYQSITIRDSKTRWGSCSASNNINLSLYLMKVPDHLIDYVILHELCHTKHHNHGEAFHALMNRVTNNNEKQLRKELNNFTTGL